jgi:hypothetical protein
MNKKQILESYVKKHKQYMYGKEWNDISEVYKGDGVTACKWCGNTGFMRTFGYRVFYNDAPCVCKIGQFILNRLLRLKMDY